MNQQEIQQSIVSIVTEFSGENTVSIANDLAKFLDTADLIYESLTTDEERNTFCKLIKFRLNGNAYARISHRQIDSYNEFKEILHRMYLPAYSINELERSYMETRQTYGESISNYGYRLKEALDKYKEGYRVKYGIRKIDDTYNKHLETNAVQTFKRGLNNIILREKIATSRAENIKEIMEETQYIDRMLTETINTSTTQPHIHPTWSNQKPYVTQKINDRKSAQIICNYCQRPNHTWDICRARMRKERRAQIYTQYQTNDEYSQNRTQHQSQLQHQPNSYPQTSQYTPNAYSCTTEYKSHNHIPINHNLHRLTQNQHHSNCHTQRQQTYTDSFPNTSTENQQQQNFLTYQQQKPQQINTKNRYTPYNPRIKPNSNYRQQDPNLHRSIPFHQINYTTHKQQPNCMTQETNVTAHRLQCEPPDRTEIEEEFDRLRRINIGFQYSEDNPIAKDSSNEPHQPENFNGSNQQ